MKKMVKGLGHGFATMLTKVAKANVSTTSLFMLYQPEPPQKNR